MQTRLKGQLMSAEEVERTLARLAHQIVEQNRGVESLAFAGIRRRGAPIAERLAKAIEQIEGHKVPVGVLDITLYRDDLSQVAEQPVVQTTDMPFSIDGMTIVLVDDVLYTGRTIRAAMDALFDFGRPRKVQLCVLIDRGHRELPIEATYVGRYVQTADNEIVEVKLKEIDSQEKVLLVERLEG